MLQEFIVYLRENRALMAKAWAENYAQMGLDDQELDLEAWNETAMLALDALSDFLENGNFGKVEKLLEELTATQSLPGMSFSQSQRAFTSVRYALLPVVVDMYQGPELIHVLCQVNQAIDQMVLYFGDFYRERIKEKFRSYAESLERQVQERTSELEESRSNYEILFEEISDGCFVNQGGRIVVANKAFCEMHGYCREDVIGRKCQELIADDSRAMVMERFFRHLKGEIPFETYTYCRKDREGNSFPTENRVKPITYKGKAAALGLCIDIMERLDLEEKVRQKDRLALIGSLTTSIAHEIRNPLSAIKVNLELLLDKLNLKGNDLRRMEIAKEQAIKLENIVSQMMDFAKPIKVNYTMMRIGEVVDQTLELLGAEMERKGICLVNNLDVELPHVMIDKEKMMEALSNIIRNAIESFDGREGDKSIEFKSRSKKYHDKKYVELSIADNGMGIKRKHLKKVFEPFFTVGKKDGIGLGLSIVKKIMEAHNGRIVIQSEEGKGACFNLAIPMEISQ